jgi:site-specific recombinase XerD
VSIQPRCGLHLRIGGNEWHATILAECALEKHLKPAAERAEIDKRIGWHTLRHTFGTLIKSQGADVATTQALMRHANLSVTIDKYVQAVTQAKRTAHSGLVGLLVPNGPTRLTVSSANA